MKIFISYTLRDKTLTSQDFNKIIEQLKGHNIFIHFFNSDIDSHKKIREKILESDILLLVKTELTFQSKWVLDELTIANKAKIPIFFTTIEDIRNH
ncbi:TIR domain-containing protein [Acinetobacter seifertii]|uniref:TIR domain-containing protein n=1 Tax=Acinetobacter seifertii TaxID=1530123 RepID=UPI0032B5E336